MPTTQKKPIKKNQATSKPLPKMRIVNPTKKVEYSGLFTELKNQLDDKCIELEKVQTQNKDLLLRNANLINDNARFQSVIKKCNVQINDLQLENVSLINEIQSNTDTLQDQVSNLHAVRADAKRLVTKLQERIVYIESRCNDFTEQNRQLLKLRNAMSLADEFKIDFIIANFEKISLSELEVAAAVKF